MRNYCWLVCGACALGLWLGAGESRAQNIDPFVPTPGYSPYLNLVRPGASPAYNYFSLVRPQIQDQRNFQALRIQDSALQRQVRQVQQQSVTTGGGTSQLPGFNTAGRYFGQKGSIAVGDVPAPRKSLKEPKKSAGSDTRTVYQPQPLTVAPPTFGFNPFRGY